ncbi:MAG: hypothetical protein US86_C0001G0001 [Candidatus Daviesbacteria bacterium GW2011_GWA2_38_24]|uniref:TNase-like domain-containing protein n=1 Tax=Candidatus Daviesbacteria bacterium GW2011_GWA2_38_24 TaxID=1618422 RepID=A0A0G0M082_9BACT|nr:MAG: hypothetical protein US86_C0001G0001 [Candidatus Daviesbacteria bacterium GW2011_GWA2_38_24]OGE22880.1 MAG: hypothetical protein A2688_04590 [Candidatus Daviesbacteria bacterium RIFCSPHIGHO2_01_FULL_38_8]
MFTPAQKNLILILVITLLSGAYLLTLGFKNSSSMPSPSPSSNSVLGESKDPDSTAFVTKVIDGDTIEIEIKGQNFKLRYIGINTPETVDPRRKVECFGKEAAKENQRLVEGREVILEKDISETDKFGRLLRYVYIKLDDGSKLFVNDYLVRQGFAQVSTYPPDTKYTMQFLQAEKEARENNRGLWGSCF